MQTGENDYNEWKTLFDDYKQAYPELAKEFEDSFAENIEVDLEKYYLHMNLVAQQWLLV